MDKIYYARKTHVKTVDDNIVDTFLLNNHRQGSIKSFTHSVSVGLFDDEELLGVAVFCPPRTVAKKKLYTTELLRLAFKNGVRVQGGASKLIAFYKKSYSPSDIFTYQDTTGKTTNVYEHCGFTLIREEKKKQYLVAPGKTLSTANRKEALGMPYATRYGPDRILGTKIGETFENDGKRRPNKDIFIKNLGWNVEETTGDRVYEWINPNFTFYTYKITATDSNKYYYGASHVKKANATIDECVNDGYFGSGGTNKNNKFNNWKKKHKGNLKKEVLFTFDKKAAAFHHEQTLIGDSYSTDKLCLNSTSGGKDGGLKKRYALKEARKEKECPIHGMKHHQGDYCLTCLAINSTTIKTCEVHGKTKHRGNACQKCAVAKQFSNQECHIHGTTIFRGKKCIKCVVAATSTQQECNVHGLVKHRFGNCLTCLANEKLHKENCPIHGFSIFAGKQCMHCNAQDSHALKICLVHGETIHQGTVCRKCVSKRSYQQKECPIHGVTTFNGDWCMNCLMGKIVQIKTCPIHGETKHQGAMCNKCNSENAYSLEFCKIHGESKHQAGKCKKCSLAIVNRIAICPIHGETKHKKDKCGKCSANASVTIKECPIHGNVKHRGNSCYSCSNSKKK